MPTKYIFITGGVFSSLGKGLTSASIAMLLENRGLKVAMLKLDPYLNVDPGTMNPFQHGEVYVTDDGAETDLDLGHYYRYSNAEISKNSNATSGQIYDSVIKRERRGDYLGKTVQVIPHITDEIKDRILLCKNHGQDADVALIEIGGTVGDIESLPFMEAIRQFRLERPKDCINIHLTYVPYLKAAGEVKSKPTQHSVQMLREIGIIPDIILCRCEEPLADEIKEKISLFCSVSKENVIDEPDVKASIYEVPPLLRQQKLDQIVCNLLNLKNHPKPLKEWEAMMQRVLNPKGKVVIGVVGKYVQHQDAYKSVFEALEHGGSAHQLEVEIIGIESDQFSVEKLKKCDACLIPGGFGERGFEGKIEAARYCREKGMPYFGICLGMQVLAVEFARHLGMKEATSTEMDPETPYPIISLLTEQEEIQDLGGTMRLGAYKCALKQGSLTASIYGQKTISERHRHRYEFNNKFKDAFEKGGLSIAGTLEGSTLCEIVENKNHPWMIGVQFHPEFQSKPTQPHPLFASFVKAAHRG